MEFLDKSFQNLAWRKTVRLEKGKDVVTIQENNEAQDFFFYYCLLKTKTGNSAYFVCLQQDILLPQILP